jgi:hypothetical protein
MSNLLKFSPNLAFPLSNIENGFIHMFAAMQLGFLYLTPIFNKIHRIMGSIVAFTIKLYFLMFSFVYSNTVIIEAK